MHVGQDDLPPGRGPRADRPRPAAGALRRDDRRRWRSRWRCRRARSTSSASGRSGRRPPSPTRAPGWAPTGWRRWPPQARAGGLRSVAIGGISAGERRVGDRGGRRLRGLGDLRGGGPRRGGAGAAGGGGAAVTAVALTVAGSDPSGGAGIQADLKTFSALGVYGTAVLTALTAQNTRGVTGVHAVPAAFVGEQLRTLLDDVPVGATKLGMLGTADVVREVAAVLAERRPGPVVCDPVMVATSGDRLVGPGRRRRHPRRPAAADRPRHAQRARGGRAARRGRRPASVDGMVGQARALLALGPGAVLLKGGHLGGRGERRRPGYRRTASSSPGGRGSRRRPPTAPAARSPRRSPPWSRAGSAARGRGSRSSSRRATTCRRRWRRGSRSASAPATARCTTSPAGGDPGGCPRDLRSPWRSGADDHDVAGLADGWTTRPRRDGYLNSHLFGRTLGARHPRSPPCPSSA